MIVDDAFLCQYGFDAYGIAFGKKQLDHRFIFCLQGGVLVMHDVPKIFGEGVTGYRDQPCGTGLHQLARDTVVAGDYEEW